MRRGLSHRVDSVDPRRRCRAAAAHVSGDGGRWGAPRRLAPAPGCCPWHRWGVESWGSERRRRRHRPRCPGQGQRITRLGPRPRARGGQAGGPGLPSTEGQRPCRPVQREARAGRTSRRTVSERGAQAVLSWGSATPGAGVALCRGDSGFSETSKQFLEGVGVAEVPRTVPRSPGRSRASAFGHWGSLERKQLGEHSGGGVCPSPRDPTSSTCPGASPRSSPEARPPRPAAVLQGQVRKPLACRQLSAP